MTLREFIELLEELETDENAAAYEVVAYGEGDEPYTPVIGLSHHNKQVSVA